VGEFIHIRRVVISNQTFISFSAHDLLEALSDADDSRPGFLSTARSAPRPRRTHGTHNPELRIYPRSDSAGGS
jgi:hypothetical protein